MFHSAFDLLSQPPEAYFIVWALALGDSVVPILPSEAALITAGLLSVVGELTLGWVIVAGALGAFCGDSIAYGLGRFVGRPFQERFLTGDRAQRALGWSRGQLDERGGLVLIVGRYVPGGRTARRSPAVSRTTRTRGSSGSMRSPRSRGLCTRRSSDTSAAGSSRTTRGWRCSSHSASRACSRSRSKA